MLDAALSPRAVPAGAGPTYRVVDDPVTFKATAATTNGAYSLFETRTPPAKGVPPHRQRYEEQAFWMLEGSYRFLPHKQELELGPGDIHERFFAEAGELIEDSRADPAAPPVLASMVAIASGYGIEIVPPDA